MQGVLPRLGRVGTRQQEDAGCELGEGHGEGALKGEGSESLDAY